MLPRRLHRARERFLDGARLYYADVPREVALDLRLVNRPHLPAHGESRAGDDAVVAAAVVRRVLALDEPGVLQPVGEAREVAPREHDAARELVHAQLPALGLLQLPEHVVPRQRRQLRPGEGGFDFLDQRRVRRQQHGPGVALRVVIPGHGPLLLQDVVAFATISWQYIVA